MSEERSSLFQDARESLAALANDAYESASEQGIGTVTDLTREVEKALDAAESLLRDFALNSPQGRSPEWFQRRAKELLGA